MVLWLLATLWVLYTTAGFLVAPAIVHRILKGQLSKTLHRQVTAERVRVNPYTFSVTIQGLSIVEGKGVPLITAQRLYVNAQLSSLPRRALVLKAIDIVN